MKSSKKAATKKSTATTSTFTPVKTLRERARKNIDKGAITESYHADRKVVIEKLNESLATEWVCVLRYMRHYFTASGMLADSVKAEFLEHAQQEQAHADLIAERIVQLGGEPDLNPDTLTKRSPSARTLSTKRVRTSKIWCVRTWSPNASRLTAIAN